MILLHFIETGILYSEIGEDRHTQINTFKVIRLNNIGIKVQRSTKNVRQSICD